VIKFYENRWKFYSISLAIILIGIIAIFVNGVALDIQFQGGAIIKYSYTGEVNLEDVDKIATDALGGRNVDVQMTEDLDGATQKLVLNLSGNEGLAADEQAQLETALKEKYPDANIAVSESSIVEPFIGKKFLTDSLKALVIAGILLVLYIWYSFRKISGISLGVFALLALLNDVLVVFFTFVVCKMPINDSFIAAALTILGLSLNDTVVIYDRIRENKRMYGNKLTMPELINKSITQSLTRTINTSVATFVSVAIVYVFALIRGIDSIITFSLPMMMGILSGVFTSVCLVCPLWASWVMRGEKKKEKNA